MFIYKITVNNKIYIGLDTKPEYKNSRWKSHCTEAIKNPKRKLHIAMKEAGIENCNYEILEKNFKNIVDLALAEIEYIKKFNSYKDGLNSSPGGDGIGYHDLSKIKEEELEKIKQALGTHWSEYNKKKWANTNLNERKKLVSHLHNAEIYQKKSESLKKFYEFNPDIKNKKADDIKKWQETNKEQVKVQNKRNGLIGAAKVSKQVIVERQDGSLEKFVSRSDFQRKTGLWFTTLVEKTKKNLYYNGYKLKE